MAIGQKEAVVEAVLLQLPTFQKYKDNAILLLTTAQLEQVKDYVGSAIMSGLIEYSKDKTNTAEVRSYSRSMVMNHLKKAKELNGGHTYISNPSSSSAPGTPVVRVKAKVAPKGVNPDLLPEDLREYVKSLV